MHFLCSHNEFRLNGLQPFTATTPCFSHHGKSGMKILTHFETIAGWVVEERRDKGCETQGGQFLLISRHSTTKKHSLEEKVKVTKSWQYIRVYSFYISALHISHKPPRYILSFWQWLLEQIQSTSWRQARSLLIKVLLQGCRLLEHLECILSSAEILLKFFLVDFYLLTIPHN